MYAEYCLQTNKDGKDVKQSLQIWKSLGEVAVKFWVDFLPRAWRVRAQSMSKELRRSLFKKKERRSEKTMWSGFSESFELDP